MEVENVITKKFEFKAALHFMNNAKKYSEGGT